MYSNCQDSKSIRTNNDFQHRPVNSRWEGKAANYFLPVELKAQMSSQVKSRNSNHRTSNN